MLIDLKSAVRYKIVTRNKFPIIGQVYTSDRPCSLKRDMHYPVELGIMLSGRMRRIEGNWDTIIGQGDVWLTSLWVPHSWQIIEGPCQRVVLFIDPAMLMHLHFEESPSLNWLAPFMSKPEHRPIVPSSRKKHYVSLAKRLMHILLSNGHQGFLSRIQGKEQDDFMYESSRQGKYIHREDGYIHPNLSNDPINDRTQKQLVKLNIIVTEILLDLMSDWHATQESNLSAPRDIRSIHNAILLAFNAHKPIKISEAALACSMNRRAFQVLFRDIMGVSYKQFCLRCRLGQAATSLQNRNDPIKVIAYEWGFSDASHFHRVFVKQYKITPRKYRELA